MPAPNPPIRAHPANPFRTIAEAARSHQLLTLHCNFCRRRMTYLASDLMQVLDPKWPVHIPPFGCNTCGKEYVSVACWSPKSEDLGRVAVRRPFNVIQTWRTVMLGD